MAPTTPTNEDRARRADEAIRRYIEVTDVDGEDSLGDLLTDLMHWADQINFDFTAALRRATDLYELETAAARDSRRRAIVELARVQSAAEGELEIDDAAALSEGDDNGAYVQAWCWVDFSGTPFDKEA